MENSTKIFRTLLIEDHPMYLDGIISILEGYSKITIKGKATTGEMALNLMEDQNFDLVISDLSLPGISGLEFISNLREKYSSVKILVLSMRCGKELVRDLCALNIDGYILKKSGKEDLFNALDHIIDGRTFFDEEVNDYMVEILSVAKTRKYSNLLSSREQDVLQLISAQHSNKQIADQLCVSISTVESHRRNMFRKTNSKCVIGLIRYAVQNDLLKW